MFASTRFARSVIRNALKNNNVKFANTYTEKTTENDPDRRSVVFQIGNDKSEQVLNEVTRELTNAGFTDSKAKITRSPFGFGSTYIRVIAYI